MKIRLLILTCLFLTTAAQEEQTNKSVVRWAKNASIKAIEYAWPTATLIGSSAMAYNLASSPGVFKDTPLEICTENILWSMGCTLPSSVIIAVLPIAGKIYYETETEKSERLENEERATLLNQQCEITKNCIYTLKGEIYNIEYQSCLLPATDPERKNLDALAVKKHEVLEAFYKKAKLLGISNDYTE